MFVVFQYLTSNTAVDTSCSFSKMVFQMLIKFVLFFVSDIYNIYFIIIISSSSSSTSSSIFIIAILYKYHHHRNSHVNLFLQDEVNRQS
jgi:hypothetical protein